MAAKICFPLFQSFLRKSAECTRSRNCQSTYFFQQQSYKSSYSEQKGDLFGCPDTDALAHCISADCAMGKGIAVLFKKTFGGVQELKNQEKKVGEVAVLKRDSRFVYYLITKERYFHKPTYDTLTDSLEAMKTHCVDNNVQCVSMPKIGCGLDGLKWEKVSAILKDLFKDTNISVCVYYI